MLPRGGKLLPLFLIELHKNETSNKILNLRSLFQIRVNTEKFRETKKAIECHRCQKFFDIAANCNMEGQW